MSNPCPMCGAELPEKLHHSSPGYFRQCSRLSCGASVPVDGAEWRRHVKADLAAAQERANRLLEHLDRIDGMVRGLAAQLPGGGP